MPEEMSIEKHFDYLDRAIRHVTAHIQTEIGLRAEFWEVGVESTGEFNPTNVEELEAGGVNAEEIRQLLFSCHVIESVIGPCPTPEYPGLVKKLKRHLLPELKEVDCDA